MFVNAVPKLSSDIMEQLINMINKDYWIKLLIFSSRKYNSDMPLIALKFYNKVVEINNNVVEINNNVGEINNNVVEIDNNVVEINNNFAEINNNVV